jgi:16S rRNA C967 or C1407 C5-methylase (RsmB/RsmF family)
MHMKSHAECEEIVTSGEKVSFFNTYEKFEDVPDDVKFKNKTNKVIRETMFDNYYSDEIKQELNKCIRVLPHHQNTSGFFITIFEKLKEFDTKDANYPL